MRLSIIIPFYNVEKYIAECLESVYQQDIPESDYEVICVNDYSPDNSRQIVLDFQQHHNNLQLIEHITNKMQGGARNTGLRAAQGEYVWFLDSDDYIQPNCVERLLKIIAENDLDFLVFDCEGVDDDHNVVKILDNNINFTSEIRNGIEVFELDFLENHKLADYTWKRITRRRFYLKNNIFFIENFHNEDVIHGIRSFILAKRMLFIPEKIVFYRKHSNSDMALRESTQKGNNIASYYKLYVDLYKLYFSTTDSQEKDIFLSRINTYQGYRTFSEIHLLTSEQRRQFYKKLKQIDDISFIYPYFDWKINFVLRCRFGVASIHYLHTILIFLKILIARIVKCRN
ncbi:MAG: glycosyltransferase [Paludibacter sp.]|jgi:glycosyltransferase involved in cell wall biosynthesis|nr:glycosyltransferase [Paludibacter sp.]